MPIWVVVVLLSIGLIVIGAIIATWVRSPEPGEPTVRPDADEVHPAPPPADAGTRR